MHRLLKNLVPRTAAKRESVLENGQRRGDGTSRGNEGTWGERNLVEEVDGEPRRKREHPGRGKKENLLSVLTDEKYRERGGSRGSRQKEVKKRRISTHVKPGATPWINFHVLPTGHEI